MTSWPPEFLTRMKVLLGNEFDAFIKSLDDIPPVSVRLNPRKHSPHFDEYPKIPWCEQGKYLPERPSFTMDPLFHAGCYYVQEASSMFIEKLCAPLFNLQRPLKALDLCAAPGGKSTHLLSLLPEGSVLVSNEIIPKRNNILRQNLVKWGQANVIVTQNGPADFNFLEDYFDLILIDAPCSGEGLFRRNPAASGEWSPAAVTHCSMRQREILETAIRCLRPGGTLIYCTCTFEPQENEEQVQWMLNKWGMQVLQPAEAAEGSVTTEFGTRFLPHRMRGEGFFASALMKPPDDVPGAKARAPRIGRNPFRDVSHGSYLKDFLSLPEHFTEMSKDDRLYALPAGMEEFFFILRDKLFIRQAGIFLGQVKGGELLPAHDLGLSLHLRKDLSVVELQKEEALRYLRGENIHAASRQKGWCLASFEGFNLGWMKILEGRTNNYFPKEWRVLKEIPIE